MENQHKFYNKKKQLLLKNNTRLCCVIAHKRNEIKLKCPNIYNLFSITALTVILLF